MSKRRVGLKEFSTEEQRERRRRLEGECLAIQERINLWKMYIQEARKQKAELRRRFYAGEEIRLHHND